MFSRSIYMAVAGPIVKAIRSLMGKQTKSDADFTAWLNKHPEIDEGARRGFADIRAGRYRKINASTRS
jgi:hypothetical protein